MAWYNTIGKENDVVISSRVRFARNISDYPFASRLDETSCREIIEKVTAALGNTFNAIDIKNISQIESAALVEKHYISREFAKSQTPRVLLTNDEKDVSVMVCEEDHIRLQCIMSGLSLDEAYKNGYIDRIFTTNLKREVKI